MPEFLKLAIWTCARIVSQRASGAAAILRNLPFSLAGAEVYLRVAARGRTHASQERVNWG